MLLRTLSPVATATSLAVIGVAIALLAPIKLTTAYLAILLCLLITIALSTFFTLKETETQPRILNTLLRLSHDQDIARVHSELAEALQQISTQCDPIYRKLIIHRLKAITEQCSAMAVGSIEFPSTESWRVAYEELLRSPGLYLYRSVAHIETVHYWQDGPGQQSTRLNLELQDAKSLSIERIAIIADYLWPEAALFPVEPIYSWLDEQHRHGIALRLVRESELAAEPDLLQDFGIYGYRAVGAQQVDPSGRTIRFMLSFDLEKVKQAEATWSRLAVYAISYRKLLDQQH